MKIYLAGTVPKGDKEAETFDNWRQLFKAELSKYFVDAEFFDHSKIKADESDYKGIVGLDCSLIKKSDLVVVNAALHLGVGTSQEMVIAKYFRKPVITVLPKNTPHRRNNLVFHGKLIEDWIHPFIHTFSDVIIETIAEIKKYRKLDFPIKDMSIIDRCIEHYNSL